MASYKLSVVLFSCLFYAICGYDIAAKCQRGEKCVPASECVFDEEALSSFVYQCHAGLNLFCCRKTKNSSNDGDLLVGYSSRTGQFPVNCGIGATADKISGGELADLGQFPWMALLGYKQRDVDIVQFLCGGSVITEYFVLSAAHCINLDRRLELTTVRFGEQNLLTKIDCFTLEKNDKVCADPYVEIAIDRVITHPSFDAAKLKNDIALIRVKQKITFTEFIKPLCLPFGRNLERRDLTDENLIVSGWGKTDAGNVGGATVLQYASVKVWQESACNKNLPPEVKPISRMQLCANGPKTQDACKGDSGGPLVNATLDKDREVRFFQVGVVSFASSKTCGNPKLPTVYTRVDRYLPWIVDNVS